MFGKQAVLVAFAWAMAAGCESGLPTGPASGGAFHVEGTITSAESGTLLPGALVEIYYDTCHFDRQGRWDCTKRVVNSTRSDAAGWYELEGREPDYTSLTIRVNRAGFRDQSRFIQKGRHTMDFALKQVGGA